MHRRDRRSEREELLRIISLCLAVERKGSDPFEVRVRQALDLMRKYLPEWKALEEFNLDAETLNRLSTIIQLQGKWLKYRSSSLYVDPFLIELKINMISPERLAKILIESWHPIIQMERLSPKRLVEAVEYWNQLQPIEERWKQLPNLPPTDPGSATVEDLLKSKILSGKTFKEILEFFWEELKQRTLETGKIPYWDFIATDTYEATVERAYLTSFLVTYGYATLEINPIEEETSIIPFKEPKQDLKNTQSVSVPIAIDYETWKSIRGGKMVE